MIVPSQCHRLEWVPLACSLFSLRKIMRHFALSCIGVVLLTARLVADEPIDFHRDVRPILSNACFQCHGPDEQQRKAKLRLDTKDGMLGPRDNGAIVAPGKPGDSMVIQRITATE